VPRTVTVALTRTQEVRAVMTEYRAFVQVLVGPVRVRVVVDC
jgi:hypothetical protein